MEEHYYKADHDKLKNLGFKPTMNIDDELKSMLDDLAIHKERIEAKRDSIRKVLRWKGLPKQKE